MTEVVRDPAIMDGDPTIEGTRILAESIMSDLRSGHSPEQVMHDHPGLTTEGVDAVVRWAEKTYGPRWRTRT